MQIRRGFRKFVRQQTWLPQCIQCTKSNSGSAQSTPSDQISGNNGAPIGNPENVGPSTSPDHHTADYLVKNNKQMNVDCMLPPQSNRHNILVEREYPSDTLRDTASTRSIMGQSSPTSSACSSHLIYNAVSQRNHQYMSSQHPLHSQQMHQFQSPIELNSTQDFMQCDDIDDGKLRSQYDSNTMSMRHSADPHSYFHGTGTKTNLSTKSKHLKKKKRYASLADSNQSPISQKNGGNIGSCDAMGGIQSNLPYDNGKPSFNKKMDTRSLHNQKQSGLGFNNHHYQQQQQQHPLGSHTVINNGALGVHELEEPVYEEILNVHMSDAEDLNDLLNHRTRYYRTLQNNRNEQDEVHDPCLNDGHYSTHSNRSDNWADQQYRQYNK